MRKLSREDEQVWWIFQQLRKLYGKKQLKGERDLISILIRTILSQNTNDQNRDRAWLALKEKFPSWQDLLKAPVEQIEKAIQSAGLARQKSRRIKDILKRIKQEQGELDLSFLAQLPNEQAKKYLLSFKGIGDKTASIILLFGLKKPAFPVDTHILRITKRLGIVPENATSHKAHQILEQKVPKQIAYELHLNLIEHGRKICKARKPLCISCPLKQRCQHWKKNEH